MKKQLGNKTKAKDLNDDILSYPDLVKSRWSDLELNSIDFTDITKTYKWERGGLVWQNRYIECNISPTSSEIVNSSLLNLIEKKTEQSYLFPFAKRSRRDFTTS